MPVRWLRERLCEHVAWFQDVPRRLVDAQASWRGNELWPGRVRDASDRILAEIERSGATLGLGMVRDGSPQQIAADRLFELEAYDHAAWHLAGNNRIVPVDRLGTGDDARYVVRLVGPRRPAIATQTGVLYSHLRYHAIVPTVVRTGSGGRYPVTIKPMVHGARLDRARTAARIKVATLSFGDARGITWRDGRATDVADAQARADLLIATLATAAREGVDVLVAPELTLPPTVRDHAINALRWSPRPLGLIVPGSFHEERPGGHYNRALLVDGQGNLVLEHHKLALFGRIACSGANAVEVIDPGPGITAVVTPIGLVAMAICLDFCDANVGDIWRQLQPEWMLVPAYGPGASAHERAARQISLTNATVTVVAHQAADSVPGQFGSFVQGADPEPSRADSDFFVFEVPARIL